MSVATPPNVAEPPRVLHPFARRILDFGVWFAVGLAPFLGNYKVPGFTAVIEMYPVTLQRWLIPLSGLFMGMIAVTIDFATEQRIAKATLKRWFIRTVATFLISLIVLMAMYVLMVTTIQQRVRLPDGESTSVTHAIVTGRPTVPEHASKNCQCAAGDEAEQCITAMSLEPIKVKACFGGVAIAFSTFGLALVYLVLTGSFAAAVGLLMLTQRRKPARP
jgi:hypothetical protein